MRGHSSVREGTNPGLLSEPRLLCQTVPRVFPIGLIAREPSQGWIGVTDCPEDQQFTVRIRRLDPGFVQAHSGDRIPVGERRSRNDLAVHLRALRARPEAERYRSFCRH
jgi:hypothetical protein